MRILAFLVSQAFTAYEWLIIIRLVLSWFNPPRYHPAVRLLYRLTEPVLAPVRGLIPPISGIDFSPILVFLALRLVQRTVVGILLML